MTLTLLASTSFGIWQKIPDSSIITPPEVCHKLWPSALPPRCLSQRVPILVHMDETVEIAAETSSRSPNVKEKYCTHCLCVDRFLSDIPNTAKRSEKEVGSHNLRIWNSDEIDQNTTCPSCKAFMKISGTNSSRVTRAKLEFDLGFTPTGAVIMFAKVWIWNNYDHRNDMYSGYLIPRSLRPTQLQTIALTPKEANSFPVGLIKPWLQRCEGEHEQCRLDPSNRLDISLYLIDVVERRIVSMRDLRERYLALSYVWGNVEFTKLTFDNMDALQKPQSLAFGSQVATIPRTIRDAMRLTADLDIRYLWVDCLCLVQDDPELRHFLDRMHLIYNNAHMTVVVANKDNADGGIDGYETGSTSCALPGKAIIYPNHVLGFDPRGFEYEGPNYLDLPWSSRGWTLQEGYFSRRTLVIAECISLCCLEAQTVERQNWGFERGSVYMPGMAGLHDLLCQSSDIDVIRGSAPISLSPDARMWREYSTVASYFSRRKFSHDGDVMKAFLGVMSFYTGPKSDGNALNTQLLYGHPVRLLINSLSWESENFTLKRRDLPLRQDGSPAIPSWSWMAWQHSAETTFIWHSRLEDDPETPTMIYTQCTRCMQIHETTEERCRSDASLGRINPESLDPYLYIRAQRAKFDVVQRSSYRTYRDGGFKIYSDAQEEHRGIVGRMIFDNYPSKFPQDTVRGFDFLGLYSSLTFDTDGDKMDREMVKALCIEPVVHKKGVFERLGVAIIRKEFWDQVAQFDENIILG